MPSTYDNTKFFTRYEREKRAYGRVKCEEDDCSNPCTCTLKGYRQLYRVHTWGTTFDKTYCGEISIVRGNTCQNVEEADYDYYYKLWCGSNVTGNYRMYTYADYTNPMTNAVPPIDRVLCGACGT